jgi:hypothetical protein
MENDYYTYAYLREDKTPYYIGKGRGNRIYDKRRTIKPPKDKSLILFLKKGLTEAEAFKHEVYMIFVLGRKDLGTGILRNLTNGGEGSSGAVHSKEHRRKNSEARIGEKHPQFGVPRTEETKKKISESKSGVPRTEETKKKISEARSGKYAGENHPNYGKTGALHQGSKAIIAIKPDGTELHFGSIGEATRELKIDSGGLRGRYLKTGNVLKKGKFKGWRFVYETGRFLG